MKAEAMMVLKFMVLFVWFDLLVLYRVVRTFGRSMGQSFNWPAALDLSDLEGDTTTTHLALSGHEVTSDFTISKGLRAGAFPDTLASVEEFDDIVFHSCFFLIHRYTVPYFRGPWEKYRPVSQVAQGLKRSQRLRTRDCREWLERQCRVP